jgi:hypothetical protein
MELLEGTGGVSRGASLRCFSERGIETLKVLTEASHEAWLKLGTAGYLELEGDRKVVVFADMEPIEGEEKQFGLVGAPWIFDKAAIDTVAGVASQSSLLPLSKDLVAFIVPGLCKALELQAGKQA